MFLMSMSVSSGQQQWVVKKSGSRSSAFDSAEGVVVDQRTGYIYVSPRLSDDIHLLCYEPVGGALLYSTSLTPAGQPDHTFRLSMLTDRGAPKGQ
jgi:hypothetical protein